jgi:citrate lyase subunit beta / citryl-CoA lyase
MARRLLRSVLFCPGDKDRALIKAIGLPADAIVFDLEDAVGPNNKLSARQSVCKFLNSHTGKPARIVRVNCPLTTEWGKDDLKAVANLPIDALILPKVENSDAISYAVDVIGQQSKNTLPIWTMIETAKGVLNSAKIARDPNVHCLVFGSNDLTKDIRAKHTATREPLIFSMSQCILAARAEGKRVLDGVHIDINDLDGLAASCVQGRNLGFDGKTLIHPNQVDTANAAYSPSAAEIELSNKIIEAWNVAKREKKGVVTVDGRLVEALHVEQAQLVLEMAEEITALSVAH